MHTFQDRALRIDAEFPVSYRAEGETGDIPGNCINISESGLFAEFSQPLEMWTHGDLTLRFGQGALGLKVRVARAMGNRAGLVFLFAGPEQRETVANIVNAAHLDMEAKGHRPAPPF